VASGVLTAGQSVQVLQGNGVGQTATVAKVLNHVRAEGPVAAGHGAGIVLDRELDVSRGDWLLAPPQANLAGDVDFADDGFAEPVAPFHVGRDLTATIAWLDDEALVPGRLYWALHGQRWVKAKVKRIVHNLNIDNLAQEPAHQVEANHIAKIELALQSPLATLPYAQSRAMGALVLVDATSNRTSGAVLVD
jgi:sulfate adenylyltransferase subunit 1